MIIDQRLLLIEQILDEWKSALGKDFPAYLNHVYRVVLFGHGLLNCNEEEREKLIIAGCFHDLGIWTHGTFDYLSPSISLARKYLEQRSLERWAPEIELMIEMHHKIRRFRDDRFPLVEVFRKADWIDVSLGLLRFGLPGSFVADVRRRFPNAGFHRRLVQLARRRLAAHPLDPLPILRW